MTDIVWQSDWIWRSREVSINDFAYFRKEFPVHEELVSARIYISAHHYVKVYVNGVKVGGYGTPAPTDPQKRKLYTEHEVSGLLREGVNCITADAHYLGGQGQNTVDGLPGFRLELHLTDAHGNKEVIGSDASWTVLVESPHRTGTAYQQNRRVSAIEDYDARKWDEAWRLSGWTSTLATADAQLAPIARDEWPMVRQEVPEGAIETELPLVKVALPEQLKEAEDMPQLFDAGRVVSGWPKLKLKGIEGVTVRLRYSENLDETGRVGHNVCNERSDNYYDQYTMRGDGVEQWQPDFSYKAFRYVEVTGYPLPIEPDSGLTVCFAYTAMDYAGSFRCSDEHLNALYDACIRTQKNNVLGQVVDCPHREQAQYLADTDLQAETLLYNFDALSVLEKTLADFADAQLADGTYPFVTPTNYEHPDFNIQIPEWDLHNATLLWKLYDAAGKVEVLADYYGPLSRMVDYYIGILDPRFGLVPLDKGWHISDWPYPSVEHKGEALTVQQIKLLQAIRIAGKAAELLGRQEDADKYSVAAKQLYDHINSHLYNADLGAYRDSLGSDRTHQGVTALALYADAVPQEERERAIAFVAGKQWECRTVLSLPLLRMLFENGREAEAFAILDRREYPGWGHMIAQGSLTMWEGWEDIESHSHAWNGYPARLLQEYVVGIKSEAPGFGQAVIRPYMPESLTFAEAAVWTVRGRIYAKWEKMGDGGLSVHTHIPSGVSARLEIRFRGKDISVPLESGEQKKIWREVD